MIEIIFWAGIALILFIYAGYPLTMSVLAALFRKTHAIDEAFTPKVTLVVAAYNEEKVIEDKIRNMLALDYPKDSLECFVLVDESTDKTEEIVRRYTSAGITLWVQRPRQGKMAALNTRVPAAGGDIIVFSDANSMYRPDALRKIVRHFRDERIVLVCGELRLIDARALIATGESAYWRYEKFLKIKESALHQLLVVNGSIYAIRKSLFTAVDPALADDFVIPMRIAKAGYGLVYEPEAINEEKSTEAARDEFRRKIRIISQGLRAAGGLWKTILSSSGLRFFEFLFHKFLRWFVFIFSGIVFITNMFLIRVPLYRIFFLAQVVFYAAALAGMVLERRKIRVKALFIPYYFCMLNLASFFGFFSFLFGERKATWEKAESTR
ncbi:MAG: glycosyltransferase family 2 protein [Candidatus Omnitrophica bacterium]|nr:glycosyltransferase family 2 protein [Candidatus Omnitrophota bacterium]